MGLSDKSNRIVDILLGIVLIFSLAAAIIPSGQTEGDSLADETRPAACLAVGCFVNASGTDVCVNSSVAPSEACTVLLTDPPLVGLFGSAGLAFILIAIALFLVVFRGIKTKK